MQPVHADPVPDPQFIIPLMELASPGNERRSPAPAGGTWEDGPGVRGEPWGDGLAPAPATPWKLPAGDHTTPPGGCYSDGLFSG